MSNEEVEVIDLLDVDTSDEECSLERCEEVNRESTGANNRVSKFTQRKECRTSRLKLRRPGTADLVHISCFSDESREEYEKLIDAQKRTYVGSSTNPFLGNALYAAEVIEEGDFICIYFGERMSTVESEARIQAGCVSDYMLNIKSGVVVDGYLVGHGAAMANHSCFPNAILENYMLSGMEKAPVGILLSLIHISEPTRPY